MPEPIRYYMDEHVPRAVSEGLRRRGIDVVTTQEAGLQAADDDVLLAHATRQGRVLKMPITCGWLRPNSPMPASSTRRKGHRSG